MLNQCVLVGKVVHTPEIYTTPKGTTVAQMVVETDRSFRNEDGTLSTDQFQVTLLKGIAEQCASVCKPGSLIALKGRLNSDLYEKEGKTYYNCSVIAEKVSFLDHRGLKEKDA